jgi:lipopolysaccharide export system permease protein
VVGAVAGVRLAGFLSTVVGIQTPPFLILQYLAVAAAIGFGILAINRGLIIEPPAVMVNAFNAVVERFARRTATT